MGYSIRPEENATEGIRRAAREEAESAVAGLRGATDADRDKAVHEARKSVKKMRAAIRLIEDELGRSAQKDNRRLRDAGRTLSDLRDAAAMIEAIDKLAEEGDAEQYQPVRTLFVEKKREAEDKTSVEDAAGEIEKVGAKTEKRSLDDTGFEGFENGMRKTYRAGRKAMQAAREDGGDSDFHEWRKRVKDHWYHLRLLEPRLGRSGSAREKQFRTLSELLGDEHNLSVIRTAVEKLDGSADLVERLRSKQNQIRTKALSMGARLYGASASDFVALIRRWWDAPAANRAKRKTA